MNASSPKFDEMGLLVAALCDGQITPTQAARLERLASRSKEAQRYFLQYVQLHGELFWEHAASARRGGLSQLEPLLNACHSAPPSTPAKQARVEATKPAKIGRRWATVAASVAVAVVLGVWGIRLYQHRPERPSAPEAVARLVRSYEAKWADGRPDSVGRDLLAGQQLLLDDGLAEVRFQCGARVILQGPARFEVAAATQAVLHAGTLTAQVPPEASGFRIGTPNATVVDLGTEFGLWVDERGPSEVHVFSGSVQVQPAAKSSQAAGPREVSAGEAVRVALDGVAPRMDRIAIRSRRFVRVFPVPGTVAGFRALVARDPHLVHHYTFEGLTPQEMHEDGKGNLHLMEVVMRGSDGGGRIEYSAGGVDATTHAIRPHRFPESGNDNGVGLQSGPPDLEMDVTFRPPQAMTVELLLNFGGFPGRHEGEISTAVATRRTERDCGFLVAVAGDGRLVHLMDRSASSWVEGEIQFIPGDWYYVASTFLNTQGETTVNSYVANLSRGDAALRQAVKDAVAPGVPAASPLGIGKGFAENLAHAYPWSGVLDEVAIYDAVLQEAALEQHLKALVGDREHSINRNGGQ